MITRERVPVGEYRNPVVAPDAEVVSRDLDTGELLDKYRIKEMGPQISLEDEKGRIVVGDLADFMEKGLIEGIGKERFTVIIPKEEQDSG